MTSKGVAAAATVCSALILSSSGVLVRSIQEADALQIAFFRAASLLSAIAIIYFVRHGVRAASELVRSGMWPLIAGPLQGLASVFFVVSLTKTSVASAVLMLSSVPLFASLIGWVFLRERVARAAVTAIAGSAVGIGFVLWGGVAGGTAVGDVLALASSLLFASFIVMLRRHRTVDMAPALVIGAAFACLISGFGARNLEVREGDLIVCIIWGAVVQGSALSLLVFAARHLVAAELCLLTLLEFVLAPVWVWLAFGEIPGQLSLLGGVIILGAVAAWALSELRQATI